jgi:hypothetical protein
MNGHLKYFLSHSAAGCSQKGNFLPTRVVENFHLSNFSAVIATFINKKRPMVS